MSIVKTSSIKSVSFHLVWMVISWLKTSLLHHPSAAKNKNNHQVLLNSINKQWLNWGNFKSRKNKQYNTSNLTLPRTLKTKLKELRALDKHFFYWNKKNRRLLKMKIMKMLKPSTKKWKKWEIKINGVRIPPQNLPTIPSSFIINKKINLPTNNNKLRNLFLQYPIN